MSVKDTFGKWPGNETDAKIAAALRQIDLGPELPDPCPLCKRATLTARIAVLEAKLLRAKQTLARVRPILHFHVHEPWQNAMDEETDYACDAIDHAINFIDAR